MNAPTTPWLNGLGQKLAIAGVLKTPTSIVWNFVSGVTAVYNTATGYWDLTVSGGGGGGSGDVVGPASSVDNRLALFSGATGKLLKQASVLVSSLLLRDGSVSLTGNLDFGTHKATNLANGSASSQEAATVAQMEAAIAAAVGAITTGAGLNSVTTVEVVNVAVLSGLAQTINGVALNTDGMTVLLTAQTTATQNGPWVVHSGAWTRPAWFAVGGDAAGVVIVVQRGTTLFDTTWLCTANTGTAVIGTNNLVFVEITEAGVTAADGTTLQKTGLIFSVKASGIGATQLANDAVTTAKILDANVTQAKLSALSITDIQPVDAATTGNITLSGSQTVDGVSLTNGTSRVLVWQQSTASQNGIYVYNSGGAWTRATDQDGASDFRPGVLFKIAAGGVLHGGKTASLSTTAAITVGTTAVAYELSNAPPVDPTDNGKIYGASSGQVALYTCTNGVATTGSNIQLAPQLVALAAPGGALKPIRQNAANNALEFFSPPSPVDGGNLTNANVTKTIADGSQFTLPASTLAASAKTLTLGTGGTPEIDEVIEVIVYAQSQDFILANSVGAAIYTVVAGTKRVLHAAWDGAQWQAAGKIRLA